MSATINPPAATHLGGAMRVEVTPNPTQTQTPPVADPNRPQWLPEKFKSPEDLAAAYSALEKKLGGTPPPAGSTPPATPPEGGPVVQITQADMDKYTNEFQASGKLSDASYAELLAKGASREVVDNYVRGQQAVISQQTAQVYNSVGGEAAYTAMIDWAGETLSEGEQAAFDNVIARGDTNEILLAVQGLKARYDSNNRAPQLIGGKPPGSNPSEPPYNSTAEMMVDMSNVKYANDPAFRDYVERRLAKSDILG